MFQVIRTGELRGTVLFENCIHHDLTDDVAELRTGYEASTWDDRLPELERALNDFFPCVAGTDIPVVFVDRVAGRKLVVDRCRDFGDMSRRSPAGFGFRLSPATRAEAVTVDNRLHLARSLLDVSVENEHAFAGNAFVRDGFDPEAQRRTNAIQRSRMADDAEWVPFDTGRYVSVKMPAWKPKTSGDPHQYERIDRAMAKHCTSVGVHRGWQAGYDLWSRGDEAFSMRVRSLALGAEELGEKRFGRLVKIKDKPTGPALVKSAAFSPSFEKVFYDTYFDVERRAQDPRRWGRAEYEKAWLDGDQEALDAPVFYNLDIAPLRADTARYMFRKVVRKAGIKVGDRYAWIHLGRHDRVEKALAEIHAVQVPEEVKEALRVRIAEYVAWAGGKRMLKVYGRRFEALKAATDALLFQEDHDLANPASAGPASLRLPRPPVLDAVFGTAGRDKVLDSVFGPRA